MAERLFLDTFFVQAWLNKNDQHHAKARAFFPRLQNATEVVTTEAILIEIGDAMSKWPHIRRPAAQFIRQCYSAPNITVVPLSTKLIDEGVQFYEKHDDKPWSLTDCISFVVMKQQGLSLAATGDKDYAQAGLTPLLSN